MILGWDIGGVNTKAAALHRDGRLTVGARAFELQRDPTALVGVLRELAEEVGTDAVGAFTCAVTMTAELSQMFRTKRDGVGFVLDAVVTAFPRADIRVFACDGRFMSPDRARADPVAVAASNWAATAMMIAARHPTSVVVDIGTTTTDVIPIVGGSVAAVGSTDPDRLASGELVYTGALRTPVEAIVRHVPYRDGQARVSAEAFALVGDAHLWSGRLAAARYTVPTPDGRPATRQFAGERLARVICGDRELIDDDAVTRIANAIAEEQVNVVASAIRSVVSRHPQIAIAVVTGLGVFIAEEAARGAGLEVHPLSADLGEEAARYAPAAAVALLCAGRADALRPPGRPDGRPLPPDARADLVIKIGGGLLAHVEQLDRVLQAVASVARVRSVLVVPGGGPFADAVRRIDRQLAVGDDAAHWMAILGMDQYAHLLASRLARGVTVTSIGEMRAAAVDGDIPVLAPSRWLSTADPLPHSWDITSDSIAAWVAREIRANELILVKPPGADQSDQHLVDACFDRVKGVLPSRCLAAEDAMRELIQMAGSDRPALERT